MLPLSNDIETLVKQVMSRVKNNYYQGMSLEQCPDFDTPLEPITIAKISPRTKYHNIYICEAYENNDQFKKDIKEGKYKSYQSLKDAANELHKQTPAYKAKKSTAVAGGLRKRKHEKEVQEDEKVNIWQHRRTIAKIIAMLVQEVRLELSKNLNLLEEKTGEAPNLTRPPNELKADLLAIELWRSQKESEAFNPAEVVDAILHEPDDVIPEVAEGLEADPDEQENVQ